MKYCDNGIIGKIVDFYSGNISVEEKEALDRWVGADARHEKMFRECLKLCNYVKLSENAVSGKRIVEELYAAEQSSGNRNRRRRRMAYAASAAVILLAGYFIFGELLPPVTEQQMSPGSPRAVLISGDTEIELDGSVNINTEDGFRLLSGDGKEIYVSDNEKEVLHRLFVPRGGEFNFALADGTHVWLNSESELTFPIQFPDEQRRVSLTGEAFFDVAKDSGKPFIVALSAGDITVYGTRFSISDYDGFPISAVLVEGSIGFAAATGESVMLDPSQRMVYDRQTGNISLETVNTSHYTSWIKNMFIFHGQTLEEIMLTLSRWYDVEIIFELEEIKYLTLSGQLSRDQDISVLLDAYREIAGIDFKITNRTIHIGKSQ